MGSIIGAGVGTGIVGLQKTGFLKSPAIATIPFTRTVLRSSGTGAVVRVQSSDLGRQCEMENGQQARR